MLRNLYPLLVPASRDIDFRGLFSTKYLNEIEYSRFHPRIACRCLLEWLFYIPCYQPNLSSMAKLLYDLSTVGPILLIMVLLAAILCAVWLIAALRGKSSGHTFGMPERRWVIRHNGIRMKDLRHS